MPGTKYEYRGNLPEAARDRLPPRVGSVRRLASRICPFPMRWHDIDFQVFLEVGHVLSDVRKLCVTGSPTAPGATVNGAQHHVVLSIGCGGESRRADDSLQFGSMDDERLADHTEPAALVQKDQFRPLARPDMNDQREFANPGRRVAARTPREALPHVRVEDKRIPRRQRTQVDSIGPSTWPMHRSECRSPRGLGTQAPNGAMLQRYARWGTLPLIGSLGR